MVAPDQIVALLSEAFMHSVAAERRAAAAARDGEPGPGPGLARARSAAGQDAGGGGGGGRPGGRRSADAGRLPAGSAPRGLGPRHRARTAAIAAEVAELAERAADAEILLEVRLLAANDRLELADPAFRAKLEEFLRLAATSRQPRVRYAALVRRATLALLAGRLEETGQLIDQAEMLGEECGEPGAATSATTRAGTCSPPRGGSASWPAHCRRCCPTPSPRRLAAPRAQVLIAAGARNEAAEVVAPLLDRGPEVMPANHQRLIGLAYAAEVTAALGIVPVSLYRSNSSFAAQSQHRSRIPGKSYRRTLGAEPLPRFLRRVSRSPCSETKG